MDSSLKWHLPLQLNEAAIREPFSIRVMTGQMHPDVPVMFVDTEDYDLQVWPR